MPVMDPSKCHCLKERQCSRDNGNRSQQRLGHRGRCNPGIKRNRTGIETVGGNRTAIQVLRSTRRGASRRIGHGGQLAGIRIPVLEDKCVQLLFLRLRDNHGLIRHVPPDSLRARRGSEASIIVKEVLEIVRDKVVNVEYAHLEFTTRPALASYNILANASGENVIKVHLPSVEEGLESLVVLGASFGGDTNAKHSIRIGEASFFLFTCSFFESVDPVELKVREVAVERMLRARVDVELFNHKLAVDSGHVKVAFLA